ncbi:MAG: hypothetical protein QOI54_3316 [Actinomycetota bacterium]|jgi:hypothetical protein|nr:hypothetical protein [Actinomycetota bacterium]
MRNCGVCTHLDRALIEQGLADGKPYQLIAAEADLSESAIRRHVTNHLGKAVLHPVSGPVALADIADRMSGLLADTAAVRLHTHETNNPSLLLKACATEGSILGMLVYRLGITDTATADTVRQGRDLVRAVREAVRDSPALAQLIAGELRAAGSDEMASAFEQMANRTTTSKELTA